MARRFAEQAGTMLLDFEAKRLGRRKALLVDFRYRKTGAGLR
jgi:hypothetical protein